MPVDTFVKIISFLEDCQIAQVRLTMTESMYVRNLSLVKAKELLKLTEDSRQKTRIQRTFLSNKIRFHI